MNTQTDIHPHVFDCDYIHSASMDFGLAYKYENGLQVIAAKLRAAAVPVPLAERFYRLYYQPDADVSTIQRIWDEESLVLGELRFGMAALLILSGLGELKELYAAREIPRQIMLDSLKDLSIWMEDFFARTGKIGLEQVWWLLFTMRGRLFRLGRLQFMHQPLRWDISVAQKGVGGPAVLFFTNGIKLREDGQADGTNGIHSARPYEPVLSMVNDKICGTPIHPGGHALRETITLDTREWHVAARPGVGSLDIHIPRDGKMDFGQCKESMQNACRFFSRYFPEKDIRIFTICSWLMDAQFQQLLSPQSNIVRFQREFYLFPVLADEKAAYERIFGDPTIDIANAPEGTTLQAAVKRFALSGGKLRFSSGIILPEHIKLFGNSYYQTTCTEELNSLVNSKG